MDILLRSYLRSQETFALLREREDGQGITEYALIIASTAILLIVARLFLTEQFKATITIIGQPGP
jgi:Flp pilus assembly pilin Flp